MCRRSWTCSPRCQIERELTPGPPVAPRRWGGAALIITVPACPGWVLLRGRPWSVWRCTWLIVDVCGLWWRLRWCRAWASFSGGGSGTARRSVWGWPSSWSRWSSCTCAIRNSNRIAPSSSPGSLCTACSIRCSSCTAPYAILCSTFENNFRLRPPNFFNFWAERQVPRKGARVGRFLVGQGVWTRSKSSSKSSLRFIYQYKLENGSSIRKINEFSAFLAFWWWEEEVEILLMRG